MVEKGGQMRILEAVLASVLILGAMLIFLPSRLWLPISDERALAWNALRHLEERGLLDEYVCEGRWDELKLAIEEELPRGCAYKLVVSDGDKVIMTIESGSPGRAFGEVHYELEGEDLRCLDLTISG